MSKSTKPRQPIVVRVKDDNPKPEQNPTDKMAGFIAGRRQAYAEGVFIAFCKNPNIVSADRRPRDVARDAIEYADALVEALFIKPLEEEAKKHNVQEGK